MKRCRIEMNQEKMISALGNQSFYGESDAYLRELLTNAVDACNTRMALERSWGTEFLEMEEAEALNSMRKTFSPRICVSYSSLTQRLTVEDNGIGMNAGDIEKYVSKPGCSFYTSDEFKQHQLSYEPVSQFGIGLLSSFMVARGVLIESKKDRSANTAWNVSSPESLEPITAKWLEAADSIEYVASDRENSGTKVMLVLKPKAAMKISLQSLVKSISHYMLYQPFPIDVAYDSHRATLMNENPILDNPYSDILGIVSIPVQDELMEGYLWLYNSRLQEMMWESRLYQQGFLVADEEHDPGICPEWIRHMKFRIHLKKRYLNLRISRDGVTADNQLSGLREMIGKRIVQFYAKNPLGLNQYLADGKKPVLTEYEEEMQLLGRAVTVPVYLKGQEIELSVDMLVHGFEGKVIRIAFITRKLFEYFQKNYFLDFKEFLNEHQLVVFEKNRDIFCQMMAPYMKSFRYVITDTPGILYEEMIGDFHMVYSVVPYRKNYCLKPPKIGYDNLFCIVTNRAENGLEIIVNEEHRIMKKLAPVWYHPKIHRMVAVILENIKQRIINSKHRWNRIVDFGGMIADDWDAGKMATVESVWCLEWDFAVSVNEYIETTLSEKERVSLGLVGLSFRREDFINWWFVPRE